LNNKNNNKERRKNEKDIISETKKEIRRINRGKTLI